MRPLYKSFFTRASQFSKISGRSFSTQRACEEVRIPGPWGVIAGKWWGPQDKRPILALHGWQDNCGTHDTLAPLLPEDIAILAIDLPGHGLSSRLPSGVFYHSIDVITFIRRLVQYFDWPTVSLMGHSLGAMCNFGYTMLFPNNVDLLICIDGLSPVGGTRSQKIENKMKTVDDFIKYDMLNSSNTEPPSYSLSELEQLLHKGSRKSIDLEACKYILKRNIAPSTTKPDQFYFTRDARLKVPNLLQWQDADVMEGCHRITCPLFLSLGANSMLLALENTYMKVLDIIKQNNKHVEYHKVEGSHHLHLNNPERVAPLLSAFMKKYYVGDPSLNNREKIQIINS